jgi:hypothetical protein
MTLSTLSVITLAAVILGLKLALLVGAVAWGLRSLFGEFGLFRGRDDMGGMQRVRAWTRSRPAKATHG